MNHLNPLSASDILQLANKGLPIPQGRALATYADHKNWVQIYHGESSNTEYQARACEWAFIGPMRPGYELAQHATDIGRIQYLERVYETADAFESWLGSNAGKNADWMVQIKCEEEAAEKLTTLLTDLHAALMPLRLKRDGKTK